jgi:hypothetical protein
MRVQSYPHPQDNGQMNKIWTAVKFLVGSAVMLGLLWVWLYVDAWEAFKLACLAGLLGGVVHAIEDRYRD